MLARKNKGMDALLHVAADHSVFGIILINDEDGQIIYANEAFSRIIGYSRKELQTLKFRDISPEDEFWTDITLGNRLKAGEITQNIRTKNMLHKNGELVLVSNALSHVLNDDGKYFYICQIRDIREEHEKSLQLKQALKDAKQATRLKSEFLANMSHEIRTPLNGTIGMAQVLAYGDLSPKQGEQVATVLESGQTLLSIVNDILDLSKIESQKLEISPIDTDLRHKLRRVEELHRVAAEEKGLSLKFFFDPSVPARLMLDPVRVRQVVENLVSNALKFTSKGKVLVVVTCQPSSSGRERVTIYVSDTGIGLNETAKEEIFKSFTQADGTITRRFGGTGLGLPIARKLAQKMGGDVTVASEVGRGSVFTFSFEADRSLSASVESPDVLTAELCEPPQSPSLTKRNVLIVDDNAINRQVAYSILSLYGINTSEVKDGDEAIQEASRNKYDLILMDVHMPKVDGVTALKTIRNEQTENQNTPIIALTADAMNGDREKYFALGFSGYVSKPISERELISEINRVLSTSLNLIDNVAKSPSAA